jgi:hypothetical protein
MSGGGITLIGLGMRAVVVSDISQWWEVVLKISLIFMLAFLYFPRESSLHQYHSSIHSFSQNNIQKNTHNKVINLLSQ